MKHEVCRSRSDPSDYRYEILRPRGEVLGAEYRIASPAISRACSPWMQPQHCIKSGPIRRNAGFSDRTRRPLNGIELAKRSSERALWALQNVTVYKSLMCRKGENQC